jgi:hypothetical protein
MAYFVLNWENGVNTDYENCISIDYWMQKDQSNIIIKNDHGVWYQYTSSRQTNVTNYYDKCGTIFKGTIVLVEYIPIDVDDINDFY